MINDNYTPTKDLGNGVTVNFAYSFPIETNTNIRVWLEDKDTLVQTLQTLGSDFTLVFDETGGTVTFASAPSDQYYVIIGRDIPETQTVPLSTSSGFQAAVVETMVDKNTLLVQDLKEETSRTVKSQIGSTEDLTLPGAEASKVIGWNAAADGLENYDNPGAALIGAEAAQAAAETAEANAETAETNAAASASAAAASAAEGMYQEVVAKVFGDSPIAPLAGEEGYLFKVDTSGGNFVVNLSALSVYGEDMKFAFVKTTSDTNTITINRGGSDTINGETSVVISDQWYVEVILGDFATDTWVSTTQGIDTSTIVKGDGTVNPTNLLSNGNFESWSAGTAVAPDGWTAAGAGVAVAREGTIVKLGTYSAKITRNGTNCNLYNIMIHSEKGIDYWKGRTVTISCWVYATVADRAYIYVDDGLTDVSSSYHTGDSTWQLLTATKTLSSSATRITMYLNVKNGDTTAYFDGAMCVEGASVFAFADKPAGEGVWADYSGVSTIVGWAAPAASIYCKKVGKLVFCSFQISGVSNSTEITFTLPYTSSNTIGTYSSLGFTYDNSAYVIAPGLLMLPKNSSTVTAYKVNQASAASWTASNNKNIYGQFFYEAA